MVRQTPLQVQAARTWREVAQSRTWFLIWRTSGAAMVLLGIATIVLSPELAGFLIAWLWPDIVPDRERVRETAVQMLPLIVIVGLIPLLPGCRMWVRASRNRVPGALALLAPDAAPPVFFLRGFAGERRASVPGLTAEEQIVQVLRRYALVVAIGRPGERLPQLGAARWYLEGDGWQGEVQRQLDRAALVFVRFGRGVGINGETGEALRRVAPQRLVLLIPAGGRYLRRFASLASPAVQRALQTADTVLPLTGQTLQLWFEAGGQVHPWRGCGVPRSRWQRWLGRRPRVLFESDLNKALRPVFEMNGVP